MNKEEKQKKQAPTEQVITYVKPKKVEGEITMADGNKIVKIPLPKESK